MSRRVHPHAKVRSQAGASRLNTSKPPRYEVIDALRGFALAGVALVNLRWLSLYEMMPKATREALPSAGFDAAAISAMSVLADGKFITVFSLLFGLGFALQLDRDEGAAGVHRYLRRMLGLALIGLLHGYFIWWGDILLTYAVVGVVLLPLRHLPDRALLAIALAVAVLPPLISAPVRAWLPPIPAGKEVFAQALQAFSMPSWREFLHGNIAVANWARMANWALVCFVLSRFLLGYWAGRKGLLQDPWRHRALLGGLCVGGVVLGLVLMGLAEVQASWRASHPDLDTRAVKLTLRMLARLEPIALGVAYAAAFVLAFSHPRMRRWLSPFAAVGRMALTHYLLQSVVGVALFYAIGLDLGGERGLAPVLLAWALLFAVQVRVSHWWLSRFQYGPVEWLWRWTTRGARPPFRRLSPEPAAA
ncbi:DUF418 domain-containing protein [Lysobacter maris]|uniref:DUF418 domain-containing protein n=1 Tax=Marilutibacter maris TaxID=1605891 RepID=A0A508B638_9GAMM|nr:DUF418 domain-containing protein [Lysobacter maris]KAB8198116.1 DUF418 domain-containing protein [Lysobacter maris]